MPRPFCSRRVTGQPVAFVFKPTGIPTALLDEIVLTLDEFEAVRLADLERLYHEQAAAKMRVSRSTFSRIIDLAHQRIADALVHGKALRIEGGPVRAYTGPRRCCRRHDGPGDAASGPDLQQHQPCPRGELDS